MNEFKNHTIGKIRSFGCADRIKNQKGVILILVALLMLVLIGFAALAIDVGFYMVTRNELQNIADGAALAACSELGKIYMGMTNLDEQRNYVYDPDTTPAVVDAAQSIGTSNKAGGLQGNTIDSGDVIIGDWNSKTHIFTPTFDQPDAVRVIARRDDNANRPISTFLARVLRINEVSVWMDATAALTGQGTTGDGELELPVGISRYFFENSTCPPGEEDCYCDESIVFNPTNDPDSCAGWNTWDIDPPNDNLLRQILDGSIEGPDTDADETVFEFIGGNLSTVVFDQLLLLFMEKGYDIDSNGFQVTDSLGNLADGHCSDCPGTRLYEEEGVQAYYPDDKKDPTPRNYHRWETTVVVYDWDDCSNPNTDIIIVGYAKISITDVQNAPEKRIVGNVECDLFSNDPTRGGGGEYGIKGTIPGLVE